VLANFLIGLREGLEATLVVSILVAYLVKTGHRDRLGNVWIGVVAAVALSLGFGALLTFATDNLDDEAAEAFSGVMSVLAVGFVTWMIFWMRRTARFLKTDLQGRLDSALMMGTLALTATAFLAVAREGLETSLFIWAAAQSAGSGISPLTGATLGILCAVGLGWLLYRRAIAINLAKFFTWTGAGLIVVAAGVLSYGVHDLQESGLLPEPGGVAWNVSDAVPPHSWYGSLLKGTVNFSAETTWLQVVVWLLYLVPVMVLFFRPARSKARQPATPASPAADQPVPSRSPDRSNARG
jgi:high-affinity iron transporter